MKLLRETIRRILLESMTNQAWSFFNTLDGFEQMSRREVPSKEQLNSRREVYYGRYVDGECQTLFQLEEREIYDYVNGKDVMVIWIHGLRSTPPDQCQGKGMGSHVMRAITQFADSIRIGVAGEITPYGSSKMTPEDMRAFDARFGLMPMNHFKNLLDPALLADEDEMWELDDYLQTVETWVWRPAQGSIK